MNSGDEMFALNEDIIALVDISGRGAGLCHPAIELGPGEKIKLRLTNCSGAPHNEGLFLMDLSYPNKAAYKEEAWFLQNKSFALKIGQEKVKFLVDYNPSAHLQSPSLAPILVCTTLWGHV